MDLEDHRFKTPDRRQRRRLKKLAPCLERMTEADRRYFRRFNRRFRFRLAAKCEVEHIAIMYDAEPYPPPPGCRYYKLIKNIKPGARIWTFWTDIADIDADDVNDEVAGKLWAKVANPNTIAAEEKILGGRA